MNIYFMIIKYSCEQKRINVNRAFGLKSYFDNNYTYLSIILNLLFLVKVLRKEKYIQDTLAFGDKKYMGVVKLKRHRVNRRLDILVTSIEEYPFALLYFTGSQALNIILRQVAIDKSLRLNEYSLTKNKKEIKLKTEEEIFNYLGYKYIDPENRTNQKEIEKYIKN